MTKTKKYYVVWIGARPGVYDNWADCKAQITAFPGAKYKSFKTKTEAIEAFRDDPASHLAKNSTKTKKAKTPPSDVNIVWESLSVDAACSGNPGIMEYQGVHTRTKEVFFRMGPYRDATNNIGEFLALIHGLALLKKNNKPHHVIYTDSRTTLSWIRNQKVKTTLTRSKENAEVFNLIDRGIQWLKENQITNPIIKWDTKNWGEIPADFGRK